MGQFSLACLQTEYMTEPLGLDHIAPHFGWQLRGEDNDSYQSAYQIQVVHKDGLVWDSGKVESSQSQDIEYNGNTLMACSRYQWIVTVWSINGEAASAESWFETGFLDSSESPWDNAQWIGSPQCGLCSTAIGIFRIESEFRIYEGGSSAGIVFGAHDERLMSPHRNTYLLGDKNYISYEIDVSTIPARLNIYRVGYAPSDTADIPFASVIIADFDNADKLIITEENRFDYHTLAIEVYGNHACAFVDGVCVDAVDEILPSAPGVLTRRGRQLNPLAINDITTYPRLCQVGFVSGRTTTVEYRNLCIKNIRAPKAIVFMETPSQDGLFAELKKDSVFILHGQERKTLFFRDPSHSSAPILLRGFSLAYKSIASARLYVTSRGIYDGCINGRQLGNSWFQPGASQFDKHLYYNVFDISEFLKPGENSIGFQLASGWWSDAQTFHLMNYNYYGDRPSLLAKLVISYEDGESVSIVTEPHNWGCRIDGAIRYASFFQGEQYDARLKTVSDYTVNMGREDEWIRPAIIEAVPLPQQESRRGWPNPNYSTPQFLSHIGLGVREVCRLKAISRTEVRPGVFIYDMGRNMVGVPHIRIKGVNGERMLLRYGETLYPALEQYAGLEGLLLTENLRDAENNDIYICKGDPYGESYNPRFTFHGYRYIEISGLLCAPPMEDVEGIVLSSISELSGQFQCSDPMVNELYQNIIWSQRANFISIPTDCPQRNERMGWMGDAQVFARTASYNADVRLFFYRYLQAVRDLQSEDGRYPNIAPVGGGFGGIAWESGGIIIPYELYKQYGDTQIIKDNYESMKRYLVFLDENTVDGLVKPGIGKLGDWLATETKTDNHLIWNAIAAYDVKIMSEMAKAIGDNQNAFKYGKRFQMLMSCWTKVFLDSADGMTRTIDGVINDTQCSYALPLYFGILDRETASVAASHLNRKTIELDYVLTTGFLGTGAICQALSEYGYEDTAYRLLRQTKYPSWLYSITQGATSIWERWNSYTHENGFGGNNNMNSFNHYSLGAVGAWMYAYIIGIRPKRAGYKQFVLCPSIASLDFANGYYDSPYGRISSEWKREKNQIVFRVTVPPNTKCELSLPKGEIISCSNQGTAWSISGSKMCTFLRSGNHTITFRVSPQQNERIDAN